MKRITSILLSLLMVFVLITPIVADDEPVEVDEAEPVMDEVVEETVEAVEETEEEEVEVEFDEVVDDVDLSADETPYIGNDTFSPLDVRVKRASSSSLKISWKKISGVTKYVVKRATSCHGTYSTIKTLSSSDTSYTNTGLKAYKEYWYQVYAYKGSTVAYISDRTPGYIMGSTADFKVTMLSPEPSESLELRCHLTWSVDSRVTAYRIFRKDNVNKTYEIVAEIGGGQNYYDDDQVDLGRTYTYKIVPEKECVDDMDTPEDISDDQYNYPQGVGKEYTKTLLPHTPSFTVSKYDATTTFIDYAVYTEVTTVQIYRATSKYGTYKKINEDNGATGEFFDSTVKPGKTYYYKVRYVGKNLGGKDVYGKFSSVKSVKAGLPTPLITIEDFEVISGSTFAVTFEEVYSADKYQVWVAKSSTGTYKLLDTCTDSGYLSFVLDQTPNTVRYYKFRAYDAETKTYSAFTKPVAWRNLDIYAMAENQIASMMSSYWMRNFDKNSQKYYDNMTMDGLVYTYCTIFNKSYSSYAKGGLKNSKISGGYAMRYKASVVDWVIKNVYGKSAVHKNYGKYVGYYSDGYYYLPEAGYGFEDYFTFGTISFGGDGDYYMNVKEYDIDDNLVDSMTFWISPKYTNGTPYWYLDSVSHW